MIKDSGERTEFATGAVRDMHAGKGRNDLLPLNAVMELAKHCEEGAAKYGEHNVDKGVPFHSLADSAMRHLMKYMLGWDDENHIRAAAWNIMWLLEQTVTKPELNDLYGWMNKQLSVPVPDPQEIQPTVSKSEQVEKLVDESAEWDPLAEDLDPEGPKKEPIAPDMKPTHIMDCKSPIEVAEALASTGGLEFSVRPQDLKTSFNRVADMKICKQCHTPFKPGSNRAEYCSSTCRKAAKGMMTIKCEVCGREFRSADPDKKTCTPVCRTKYQRMQEDKVLVRQTRLRLEEQQGNVELTDAERNTMKGILIDKKCFRCGKKFYVESERSWVYKQMIGAGYKLMCSYRCLHEFRKEHGYYATQSLFS